MKSSRANVPADGPRLPADSSESAPESERRLIAEHPYSKRDDALRRILLDNTEQEVRHRRLSPDQSTRPQLSRRSRPPSEGGGGLAAESARIQSAIDAELRRVESAEAEQGAERLRVHRRRLARSFIIGLLLALATGCLGYLLGAVQHRFTAGIAPSTAPKLSTFVGAGRPSVSARR